MGKKFTLLTMYILIFTSLSAQYWKATGALAASGSNFYLIGAANVGDDIFALNANKTFAYSADKGETWIVPTIAKPNGDFAGITGIKDRLYATMKINTFDYELYYSTDKGSTWTLDTIGLPKSITKTGKSAVILKYMGNDYVLAHDYKLAYYKKLGETKWNSSHIDNLIVDIAATSDKWLAVGQTRIFESTDKGASWNVISTTGLPDQFQGNIICSNGSRIFVSNAPANGGDDIYFSDDGGSSWTLTNSAGKFDFDNPWVQSMYAVGDYVFASIKPKLFNFADAPPFIVSTTQQPDFSVGDLSGLPTGKTNTHLPFFFHLGSKLFTMFWDVYSSEPGFKQGSTTSAKIDLNENRSITIYPNPASHAIQIQNNKIDVSGIEIYSMSGEKVFVGNGLPNNILDISGFSKGFYLLNIRSKDGHLYSTKFIKN
jgi:photosystem II stability/assembly factor-like uncharacterized protein